MAARVGKQKGKHGAAAVAKAHLEGLCAPCSQLLKGEEHPEVIWYNPHVICPAGLRVPHVPRQTLTAPWRGKQHSQRQHPATMAFSTLLASSLRPTLAALHWAACRQCRGLSTPQGSEPSLNLGGIFPPLATPFSPTQEVDYAQLEGNLRRYASIPFRGKCCPLSFSMQAPVRSLPATEAACRQPASFPRVLSLQLDFAPGLATPRVTHLGPFAQHVLRHTSVSLHTPTTC